MNLVQTVRKLAADYPDAVYQGTDRGCFYTIGECGPGNGCIVGQALQKLGYELEGFDEQKGVGIGILIARLEIPCSCQDKDWLIFVQDYQDMGKPWKEAVKLADETVEEFH